MKFQIAVHIETNAADDKIKYLAFDERYRLTAVKVVNDGGVAADNTDYSILNVFGSNGSTSAFQWSTQDTAQGALTDGVSASLVDQKSGLDVYNAGTSIKISKTKGGSGKAVDCMLLLSFEPARKF